jgi:hypothetical protein
MLAHNPLLSRELAIRSKRVEGYRLFNYSGPGRYLLLLCAPILFDLLLTWSYRGLIEPTRGQDGGWLFWAPSVFLVTVWLQVLYFSHAAARYCAGSIAVERERGTLPALLLLPRPLSDLLRAKMFAALAPLIVEAVLSMPLLALYACFGVVRPTSVLYCGLLDVSVIVFFGCWGMYWSVACKDVVSALSRAFCTCFFVAWGPLVLSFLVSVLSLWGEAGFEFARATLLFSPLYVVGALVQPVPWSGGLWPLDPLLLCLVIAVATLSCVRLWHCSLRRLCGR